MDALVAVVAYGAALALRFGADLPEFLPLAERVVGIVVPTQLLAFVLLRTYRSIGTAAPVARVAIGSIVGTLAGGLLAAAVFGRTAVSVSALAANAVLLASGAALWRAAQTIWRAFQPPIRVGEIPPGMEAIGVPKPLARIASDVWRYRGLVSGLVARDLKLKYRGSVLGFLWSMLNPLAMVTVYTIAFTYFMPTGQPGFVLHLLVGVLAWTFFAGSAASSNSAIVDSGGLLKSVYFPRLILPLAGVLFNLTQYLLTLVVFLPFVFLYYRVPLAPSMLAFPLIVVLQLLFTTGVALTLSALTALYRDVRHLTEIGLSLMFWLTPIVYSYPMAALGGASRLLLLSPMASFVVAAQQIFYNRSWPDGELWIIAALYGVTMFAVGAAVFLSLEDRFGEQV